MLAGLTAPLLHPYVHFSQEATSASELPDGSVVEGDCAVCLLISTTAGLVQPPLWSVPIPTTLARTFWESTRIFAPLYALADARAPPQHTR